MAHHNPVPVNYDQRFEFTAKAQSRLIMLIIAGVVAAALGCFIDAQGWFAGHHAEGHATEHVAATTKPAAHADPFHKGVAAGHDEVKAHAEAAAHGEAAAHEGHNPHADKGAAHQTEGHAYHWYQRLFANLWLDGVFFTGLAVIGIFFVAVNYVAEAGWSAGIKRVPEALGSFLPYTLAVLLITFLLGSHSLFHWTDASLYDENSPHYDEILAGKSGYLNIPFFLARMVVFVGLWIFFNRILRKNSLGEDVQGGTSFYKKNIGVSATFLVIFAVSSSMVAWDWVMSIEPHWFSTLFGWYMFASWFVSGLSTIALILTFLKARGYMGHVSSNHLHDVGKFMFAFTIFWTYLWTAQYLLIFYANLPEESIYFIERLKGFDGHYTALFFMNIFLNFVFPFLFLMTRDAKRTPIFLQVAACGLLMSHWLDFYLMVMPGTVGGHAGFGLIEFGLLTVFVSAFILVVSRTLAAAPLVAKNHPMLGESLVHDI